MRLTPIDLVEPGEILGTDVTSGNKTIYPKGKQIEKRDLENLKKRGVFCIYLEDATPLDDAPVGTISRKTRTLANDAVIQALNHPDDLSAARLQALENASHSMVEEILSNEHIKIQVHDLRSYDDYTYKHSVNVAAVSLAIAKNMSLPKSQLELIALAALLHDIGKMGIPLYILNKEGPLTDNEAHQIKEHPIHGFEILSSQPGTDPIIWAIALQHHEMMDGSGYPNHRMKEDINPLSRVLTVADIWDALRSSRPYKKPWPTEKVTRHLGSTEMRSKLDSDCLSAFLQIVMPYPEGSMVRLNSGEICVVVESRSEQPELPVIRKILSATGRPIEERDRQTIDLMNVKHLSIASALS